MADTPDQQHRFLFLLYFLPPAYGSAPLRNERMMRAISGMAPGSVALTAEMPERTLSTTSDPDIRQVRPLDYRSWLRRKTKDGYLPEHRKRSYWKQTGIRLINSFPLNVLIGEGGWLYVRQVIREGERIIQSKRITHLYSSYRPMADHYAAFVLKRRHPHLIWIADFRDVVMDPHYQHHVLPAFHHRLYRNMFSHAMMLTTVSHGLAQHFRQWHENVVVTRNGMKEDHVFPPVTACECFRITYTGSSALHTRSAIPLFKALRRLCDERKIEQHHLQLHYAGKDSHDWKTWADQFGFADQIIHHGIVDGTMARLLQIQSCINIVLTMSSADLRGVLSGKLIEYMEAGRPVLCISKGNRDEEIDELISSVSIGSIFTDADQDLPSMCDFIYREYQTWLQTGCNRIAIDEHTARREFSQRNLLREFNHQVFQTTSSL